MQIKFCAIADIPSYGSVSFKKWPFPSNKFHVSKHAIIQLQSFALSILRVRIGKNIKRDIQLWFEVIENILRQIFTENHWINDQEYET